MLDRVPTKPNRYAVYDENHNFIRYEYHERADEPTQEGDALNKANLLPDDVATALGLTGNPQVADALTKLSSAVNPLQYVWAKNSVAILDGSQNDLSVAMASSSATKTIYYSDAVKYTNGAIQLASPIQSIDISYDTYNQFNLTGKYAYTQDDSVIRHITGAFKRITSDGIYIVSASPSYYINAVKTCIEQVASYNGSEYPDKDSVGSYYYESLGRPQYIGTRIATGSYTGTGTYGSSNRNSITFDFDPKMIFILPDDANYTGKFFTMWINGMNLAGSRTDYTYPYQLYTNLSGKTFTFYGDKDAESQLNKSGTVYYYFAIG